MFFIVILSWAKMAGPSLNMGTQGREYDLSASEAVPEGLKLKAVCGAQSQQLWQQVLS